MQDINETMGHAVDLPASRRVFGEPIERGNMLVLPVAAVRGGGGGGGGEGPRGEGHGSGAGFAMSARPLGAFVIDGDKVRWVPAVDPVRMMLVVQGVVLGAALLYRAFGRPRRKLQLLPGRISWKRALPKNWFARRTPKHRLLAALGR